MNSPKQSNEFGQNDGWQKCRRGQLSNVVLKKAVEDRRRFMVASAAAGAAAISAVAGVGLVWNSKSSIPSDVAFTCNDVYAHMDAYLAKSLSKPLTVKFEEHLDICGHCRHTVDQLA